jgi:hypothetical protein
MVLICDLSVVLSLNLFIRLEEVRLMVEMEGKERWIDVKIKINLFKV